MRRAPAPTTAGLSLGESPVAGFGWIDRRTVLGSGTECFEQAAVQLTSWQLHRAAGLRVECPGGVTRGTRAALRTRFLGCWVAAPVEVVLMVDEPARRGFCYRALPGHPEEGEESFMVSLLHDGTVELRIRAWSRPRTWWARLGAPVARREQARITTCYLAALAPR